MSWYGLDPEEACDDPKVLRELIGILKEMVAAQKGMNRANNKIIATQERLINEQEEKISLLQEKVELVKGINESVVDRLRSYEVAFSAAHHNDLHRLN